MLYIVQLFYIFFSYQPMTLSHKVENNIKYNNKHIFVK